MKINLLLAIIFFLTSYLSNSFAQKDFTIEANDEFSMGSYYKAIELYKKSYAIENSRSKKAEILFKIGECYRLIEDPKQSQVWYDKAIKANYPDPLAVMYYADAIKAEGRYDEALTQYQQYIEKAPNDPRGATGVKSCEMVLKWNNDRSRIEIQNEIFLNSTRSDICPTFADDKNFELIFVSNRISSNERNLAGQTEENDADLFYSIRNNGKWSLPVLLNEPLNSEMDEGSPILNTEKNNLYFTRCHSNDGKKTEMICKIYCAKKSDQKWDNVELIPIASDSITVGHPALSDDESIIIFTAIDMSGGIGKKDLWYSKYDSIRKIWLTPVNLGPDINTPENELYPYINMDGTLYFASDGHVGMGQLDIFKAQKLGPEKWGKVENLKSPINSPKNEFGIIFEGKDPKGYFCSDRAGGKGNGDIYSFYIHPLEFVIQGNIIDDDTKYQIEDAVVKLIGTDGLSVETKTDRTGFYFFSTIPGNKERYIRENTSYQIFVSKENYLSSKGEESTVDIKKSTIFVHDFAIKKKVDEKINAAKISCNEFVGKKNEHFAKLINSGKSGEEIKSEAAKLSKSLLKGINIQNWEGEILNIDQYKDSELDISISIQRRKIVGQKNVSGRVMDCGITIEAIQAKSKTYGYTGVVRNGDLYNKIQKLKQGDRVTFSATVINTIDNTESTGLNLSTLVQLKLIDIKKIN